ncbi:MAG: Gfo/Idh/MocA family oxidoreductase [bacterium]|nr:Gfo/Idh/MocA family oxidoreductase [bacterium]
MDKIRIGIIGCGGMATGHASRFDRVREKIVVTAVADVIKERAEAVAGLLDNKVVVATDYHDILKYVDAVLIVLPHHLHCEVSLECMDAGKHVLVEKPMANTEKECIKMINKQKEKGVTLMVAYCMRYHPLIREMKRLVDEKKYGDIFQMSIWTEQLTIYPEGHWARSAKLLGGGQLFSHGCHYIDLLLWFLGKPLWGCHIGTNRCTPWMEREGTSNVTIEFEKGILGYHFGTWGARGSRLKYSFHAHCEDGMLEVSREKGQLILHHMATIHDAGTMRSKQVEEVLMEVPDAKPTDEEMAHFVDCIITGKTPLTDAVSSLEGLRVIWKLYEAEQQHKLADLKGLGFGTARI